MADVCRICLDGPGASTDSEALVSPCACRGSTSYVHKACLREWCIAKDDFSRCDLCHQEFVGPTALFLAQARMERASRPGERQRESKQRVAAHALAAALDKAGRYDESVDLLRKQLVEQRKRLGGSHPDTLVTVTSLAHVLGKTGQNVEALDLHRFAVQAMSAKRGPSHPHVLTAKNNLALALFEAGRREDAAGLHQEVLSGRSEVLGKEHPDTLNSANNLAGTLTGLGKHDEAVELYVGSVQTLGRVLGEAHPNTLTVATNLAIALSQAGRRDEAVERQRRTLAAKRERHGSEHADTAKAAELLDSLLTLSSSSAASASTVSTSSSGLAAGLATASMAQGTGRPPGSQAGDRKRIREDANSDEILAFLVHAGVNFEDAAGYAPRLVATGFDCVAALRTLTLADLCKLKVRESDRQLLLAALGA